MSVTTPEHTEAIQFTPEVNFHNQIVGIVEHCFDASLLERQRNITRYHGNELAPIAPNTQITLGAVAVGTKNQRTTYIGNVERIAAGTEISEGAHIGDSTTIRSRVVIERGAAVDPYCLLDHSVRIGENVVIERGAKLLVQSSVATNGRIAEGVELGCDRTVESNELIQPFTILY